MTSFSLPTYSTTTTATTLMCGGSGGSTAVIPSNLYFYLVNQIGSSITSQTLNNILNVARKDLLDDKYFKIDDGKECIVELPDGTKINIKIDGSFDIEDKDAKVTYRANRVRNFNPFLNASDKLEDFIRFCGKQGVRKRDILQLPISLFIGWLILEAAKADNEPEPSIPLLPNLQKIIKPKCIACGRFISPEFIKKQIAFCNSLCFNKHYDKMMISG